MKSIRGIILICGVAISATIFFASGNYSINIAHYYFVIENIVMAMGFLLLFALRSLLAGVKSTLSRKILLADVICLGLAGAGFIARSRVNLSVRDYLTNPAHYEFWTGTVPLLTLILCLISTVLLLINGLLAINRR